MQILFGHTVFHCCIPLSLNSNHASALLCLQCASILSKRGRRSNIGLQRVLATPLDQLYLDPTQRRIQGVSTLAAGPHVAIPGNPRTLVIQDPLKKTGSPKFSVLSFDFKFSTGWYGDVGTSGVDPDLNFFQIQIRQQQREAKKSTIFAVGFRSVFFFKAGSNC